MTLNERISTWWEPRPTQPTSSEYSPKFAWKWGGDAWEAVAWDTDEAANARLLDAMAASEDGIRLEMWIGQDKTMNAWIQDRDLSTPKLYVKANDRKIAIRMAFCKWAGIKEETFGQVELINELREQLAAKDAEIERLREFERAIVEEAMLTEAVSPNNAPKQVINEIIGWHLQVAENAGGAGVAVATESAQRASVAVPSAELHAKLEQLERELQASKTPTSDETLEQIRHQLHDGHYSGMEVDLVFQHIVKLEREIAQLKAASE